MEIYASGLATEFVRRSVEVTAVLPEAAQFDSLARDFGAGGATVVRLDTDARSGRFAQLSRLYRLYRLARSSNPTVIHVHTGGSTGGLAALAIARLSGSRATVLTEHDVPPARPPFAQRLSKRASERLAHVIVVGSEKLAQTRAERIGRAAAPVIGIPVGIEVALAPVDARSRNRRAVRDGIGIPQDHVVVGTAMRFVEGKGLPTLLEAFGRAEPAKAAASSSSAMARCERRLRIRLRRSRRAE